MTELLSDPRAWIAFLTLTGLELVLGIDNIIFISILVDKLPAARREAARRIGLFLAMFMRVGLLLILFAPPIGNFVSAHPTVKMLALSFLLVIGLVLIADGFGTHIPQGYVYFAMAFSVFVEMLNLRMRKRRAKPVDLHERYRRDQ